MMRMTVAAFRCIADADAKGRFSLDFGIAEGQSVQAGGAAAGGRAAGRFCGCPAR
jgi:hypothetical protein